MRSFSKPYGQRFSILNMLNIENITNADLKYRKPSLLPSWFS